MTKELWKRITRGLPVLLILLAAAITGGFAGPLGTMKVSAASIQIDDVVRFAGQDWRVIDPEDNNGGILVALKDVYKGNVTRESRILTGQWEGSNEQRWCDGEFLNLLKQADPLAENAIKKVKITNLDETVTASQIDFLKSELTVGGQDASDKVFYLSIEEWQKYLDNPEAKNPEASDWWDLRNFIKKYNLFLACVNGQGNFVFDIFTTMTHIRPALYLDSSLFTYKNSSGTWVIESPANIALDDNVRFGGQDWVVVDSDTNNGGVLVMLKDVYKENGEEVRKPYYENLAMKLAMGDVEKSSVWFDSDARKWCNGTFLDSLKTIDPYAGNAIKKVKITTSRTKESYKLDDSYSVAFYKDTVGLNTNVTTDSVFLLSVEEYSKYASKEGVKNTAASDIFLLRSPDATDSRASIGAAAADGSMILVFSNYYYGMRPALYLDASYFLFKDSEGTWVIEGANGGRGGGSDASDEKAEQKLTIKKKVSRISYKKLKKKSRKITAVKVTGAKGSLTYKKVSVSPKKYAKRFTVNKNTGKITVKKGTKKGTYKVKVKISAAATNEYNSAGKTVVLKIRVK